MPAILPPLINDMSGWWREVPAGGFGRTAFGQATVTGTTMARAGILDLIPVNTSGQINVYTNPYGPAFTQTTGAAATNKGYVHSSNVHLNLMFKPVWQCTFAIGDLSVCEAVIGLTSASALSSFNIGGNNASSNLFLYKEPTGTTFLFKERASSGGSATTTDSGHTVVADKPYTFRVYSDDGITVTMELLDEEYTLLASRVVGGAGTPGSGVSMRMVAGIMTNEAVVKNFRFWSSFQANRP